MASSGNEERPGKPAEKGTRRNRRPGKETCEATGSGVGSRVGSGIHREWLPAAIEARLRIAVCLQFRRIRVGTSDADSLCPANGAGGRVAAAAAPGTPIQLAGVGVVRAGAWGA